MKKWIPRISSKNKIGVLKTVNMYWEGGQKMIFKRIFQYLLKLKVFFNISLKNLPCHKFIE